MRHLTLLAILMVALAGCFFKPSNQKDVSLLSDGDMAGMLRTANAFWAAARAGDSAEMRRLTVADTAITWAQRWVVAYPTFFDSTNGRLVPRFGYYLNASRSLAVIEVEAPWVTCKAPVYDGANDRYFVRASRLADTWVIWRVWSEPC